MFSANGEMRQTVRSALQWLADSPEDGAFVIFEDAATGKFVQFCGSAEEGLMLDLPEQTLSEADAHRAVAYFRRFGVEVEADPILDGFDGPVVDWHYGFNMNFTSVDEATEVTLGVFREVYQMPRVRLVVTQS
jgi:hypothetical protein